jgi:PBP1b-binding outer membrane lipoprotein LpoB
MNKKIIILILILLISGCVQNEGKTVYFSQKSNETLTFYPDHTMTAMNPKTSGSGAYRIDGDYMIITFPPFGTVVQLKRSGNILTDEKTGEIWERI